MSEIFNAIVQLLNEVCHSTGLSYFEINILLYTFFIPATWWAIVWWRLRKWPWLWLFHLGAPLIYYYEKENLAHFSERFYDSNTQALLWLGNGDEVGYIQVSIFVGIVLPAMIYLSLWLIPNRVLTLLYAGLMVGNLSWYAWTWFRSDTF
ncbi:MAG: hypothetical protein KA138_04210 [Saprospiraceae bacterium]|nr:hypothetical protein [Lewinellaceae bacterium]MBP6810693.1 hypothetical protein [Saprospiraceae bacterium]